MKTLAHLTAKEVTAEALTEEERAMYSGEIPDWSIVEALHIEREFTFDSFVGAIAFVGSVAEIAETEGHHPDIDIRFKSVTIRLSTHDAGALTLKDFIVATKIDTLSEN